jgi:trimethylamine--corrinoid protein Co-methyltransferase
MPLLSLFSPAEVEALVCDALLVLERVGVLVEHGEGRALLLEAGAREQGPRLLLPEALVRAALATAPARFEVCDRDGAPALAFGAGRTQFDPGSAALFLWEPATGRRREATSADCVALARLVDDLSGYQAQSTALVPADVPREVADRHRLYLALRHAKKPVVTGTFAADGFAPMQAMLEAVRGGALALRRHPLAIFDCCPSPPLCWSALTCDSLIRCARAGIPAQLISMPLTGATAPVTLREVVVQHCAESLSGVALHQTAGPGAPLVFGGCPSAFDMRHGTTVTGSIETALIDVAYAQVGRHLGLPTHTYLGQSDAKAPDYQAGMESGMGVLLAVLAGFDLVSGPGILDFILTQSLEKLLLDHEACLRAQRFAEGIARREVDLIEIFGALTAKGSLLGHPHTRAGWRRELGLASPVVDRGSYGDWDALGAPWAHQRAQREVVRRLAAHEDPPLAPEIAAALDALMLAELRAAGVEDLPSGATLRQDAPC